MNTASLVFGILAIIGMFFGFIPCLGALNWINIPFAFIGLIICIIALSDNKNNNTKNNAVAGLIMCLCAIFFGLFRLLLGGGIF